jgi:hypothetical protein
MEAILRYCFKTYKTHYEKGSSNDKFYSPYSVLNDNKHLAYYPFSVVPSLQHEFNYKYKANSLGFFGIEADSVDYERKRILTLGDSFTHGIGAPIDSTWPISLEYHLNLHCDNYQIINAGLQGSDPIYQIAFLKDVLIDNYNPDIIVFAFLSSTDKCNRLKLFYGRSEA